MKIKFRLLLQISLLLFSISSFSQNVAPASTHWNLKKGLALEGYDPVSYFQGDPEEGSKDIAASFNGATYYFVSKKNQSLFTENPQKFVPEYGGWCAYAMGNDGNKVKGNFSVLNTASATNTRAGVMGELVVKAIVAKATQDTVNGATVQRKDDTALRRLEFRFDLSSSSAE